MTDERGAVTLDGALEVIAALAEAHTAKTGRPLRSVVAFGGTAMAALVLRARSYDVDLYVADIDDDVLDGVTRGFKARFGPTFKIDATPSKLLWGAIVIDDIDASPLVTRIRTDVGEVEVKALSAETMYLVKVAADRPKDQLDIETLARRTSYDSTLTRAKQLFRWYADRNAFPEHAERLARYMARDHGKRLHVVDDDFDLPAVVQKKVRAIRQGLSARFLQTLKEQMRRRPDLLTFDPSQPRTVCFDARAAGMPDEILALMSEAAGPVADIAAIALKEVDLPRHMARLAAIAKAKKRNG